MIYVGVYHVSGKEVEQLILDKFCISESLLLNYISYPSLLCVYIK